MAQNSSRRARPHRSGGKSGRGGRVKARGRRTKRGGGAGDGVRRRGGAMCESERPSLYDEVTRRIVRELEAGCAPWVQPWGSGGASVGLPRNAVTSRAYSGINVLLLWGAVIRHGFPTQDWLTFRQAQQAGGSVRNGARGTGVVFAGRFTPEDEKAEAPKGEEEPRAVPFLRRYTVFNVAQCDGLNAIISDPVIVAAAAPLAVGEALIRASGIEYRIGGDQAFYAPIFDFVAVPPPRAFPEPLDYYRTALHELAHATGHRTRLGRDLSDRFGSTGYAREELVAELGAAFLCAALGIAPTVRHAEYLGAWLDVLRADNRAIFRAASEASKAADWLLARLATPDAGAAA